ncbi:hypothetical protein ACIRBX_26570 [Kitasatospora sp. NPDC096147]|uniref:hypothetical protein n=1 Tax=Kitasatospora sp. NPDC096147 TaxID=3364093 RepID=UPI00381AB06A
MTDTRTSSAWQPPAEEVEPAYQPVEVGLADGDWAVGRINGWWRPATGRSWCRVRLLGRGEEARWMPFDPDRLVLLPSSGI